jgi:NAD-specific glutamate dehydrogenase
MERLRERAPAALAAIDRERVQAQVDALCADGIGRALAERLAVLPWLVRGIGAVSLASEGSHPLERALEIHAAVGEATRITWLLDRLEGLRRYDGWDRIAAEALHVEMLQVQRALTLRAIESDSAIEPLAPLRRAHGHVLQRIEETAQHIESDERGGLAPLAVLSQQIRRLC